MQFADVMYAKVINNCQLLKANRLQWKLLFWEVFDTLTFLKKKKKKGGSWTLVPSLSHWAFNLSFMVRQR